MTTLAKYIDMIARAPETEAASAAPAPKGRGSLPRKPKSTFNPLKADKALTTDDDAIVQAYRSAVTTMQQADPELGGKPFTLEDEQILVTVRSVPGPSTEEIEGQRINALLKATGVVHQAPDISAADSVASHHAEAVQLAADFPEAALRTMRKLTEANEFNKIGALVLRQDFLDDPKKGADFLRMFRRIGAKEGVKDEAGILHNSCEYYKEDYKDKNGVLRTKFHSIVLDMVNETDDGRKQQEPISIYSRALTDKAFRDATFPHADDKTLNDGLNKWRQRNGLSVAAMRQAIHIEQLMADLEKNAPNVVVQVKYKTNAQGEMTNELRNSPRPIIIADKSNLTGTSELSIREFLRFKVYKAVENVPEARKTIGPNVMQLKQTIERKTAPNKGQGKKALAGEAAAMSVITSGKAIVNAHTMRDILTITLPNYFVLPPNPTVNEKRDYQKRMVDLKSLLSPKDAEGDILTIGHLLRELNNPFFGQFMNRFEALVSQQIDQLEQEAEAKKKLNAA